MIGKTARISALVFSAIASAGLSIAHPGHDHAHSDHAVYDMAPSASNNAVWIVIGAAAVCLLALAILRFSGQKKS